MGKNYVPHLCIFQTISASWGSFWGMHPPPPTGTAAADRLNCRSFGFRSTKPWGGGYRPPPPSTTPEMVEHPSGSNPGWQPPPCPPPLF